jgi:hypothetical protein
MKNEASERREVISIPPAMGGITVRVLLYPISLFYYLLAVNVWP